MSTDEEQRQQAALRDYARSFSDEQWRLFTAEVRPPTDAASVRASLAHKAADMLATPKDHNGPVGAGSFAAAVAARQPAPPQQTTEAPQFQPPANQNR